MLEKSGHKVANLRYLIWGFQPLVHVPLGVQITKLCGPTFCVKFRGECVISYFKNNKIYVKSTRKLNNAVAREVRMSKRLKPSPEKLLLESNAVFVSSLEFA